MKFFRSILVMIIYYVVGMEIGYWMGYDIVINVDDIEKEYLYAGDCCSTDEFICVGNILNFIEEIVKNGGDPYWTINENQYRDFSKK